MTYRILLWLSITFTSVCGPLSAYTIDTGLIKFVQPNGVEFVGREWSEGYVVTRETEDGFKFLQDNDRYYYYAELHQRGDFSPTQLKVGIDDPVRNNLSKNLDRSADREAEINDALTRSRNPFAAGVAGKATAAQTAPPLDITIGIILVEFADVKGSSYTESDFEDMFFGSSYDNTDHPDGQTVYGSIAAYWDQVSNGDLTITDAAVSGGPTGGILNPVFSGAPSWVPLAGNKADYHLNERMWEFRTAAKNAADNMLGGDIDADSDNTFRIAIVYAGNLYDPQWTACGSNCGLTPHAILNGHEYVYSELRDSNHNTDERNCDDGTTSPGDCTYNTIDFAHIGSHVHEIGHTLGLAARG